MAGPADRAALIGLAALAVGMGIGRFAFTPILPMMQAEGLSLAAGGWLASANYAGYLAGALSARWLRGEHAIRAGLAVIAFTTLGMAWNFPLAAWLVLRAAAGIASAWLLVNVSAWCLQRGALGGVVYSGVGAGSAAAGLTCLVLMQAGAGPVEAWIALGAAALAATVLLWPVFHARDPTPESAPAQRWSLRSARLVLCYAAYGFGYIIPATFLPAMAREALGAPALFGWAWPVFGAAAAASTLAASPLARRFGTRRVWIGGHLIMAAGVVAPLVLPGIAGIALAAVCVGATFVVITMVALQEGGLVGGAPLMAAMTAGFAAGQIAGPAFVSLLAAAGGGLAATGGGLPAASYAACFLLVASAAALLAGR
ncbi:MAG TPA: YbfB/YjiJ family MFS transporter [Burkholderiales bacterium]|nr:YbfB/YjiJ family MFS transporter [Burkholderiales bacterium]